MSVYVNSFSSVKLLWQTEYVRVDSKELKGYDQMADQPIGHALTQRGAKARLAKKLREKIIRGDFPPGSQLPSVNALVKAEQISNMTASNAYKELIEEGLVVAVERVGFFVRRREIELCWQMNAWQDPRRLNDLPEDGWTAAIEAAGYTGSQNIRVGIVSGSHSIAGCTVGERLSLGPEASVTVRNRVRYIRVGDLDEPQSLADSYYSSDLVQGTAIARPASVNTAAILGDLGADLEGGSIDELIPRLATREETDTLALPAITAVQEIVRTCYSAAGKPVLVQHFITGQGSKFVYHVTYPGVPAEAGR